MFLTLSRTTDHVAFSHLCNKLLIALDYRFTTFQRADRKRCVRNSFHSRLPFQWYRRQGSRVSSFGVFVFEFRVFVFEFWVLRFRDFGASCFGLRFRVLRFRVLRFRNYPHGMAYYIYSAHLAGILSKTFASSCTVCFDHRSGAICRYF